MRTHFREITPGAPTGHTERHTLRRDGSDDHTVGVLGPRRWPVWEGASRNDLIMPPEELITTPAGCP